MLVFVAVGWLLPLWAGREVERTAARIEAELGPLEPTVRHGELAPEANATPGLIEAARAVQLDEAEKALIKELANAADPSAIADRRDELAPLIERNRPAIDLLLATAGLANDFGVDFQDVQADPRPELLARQFQVAKLAYLDAHLALLDGDPERAERVAAILGQQAARYGDAPDQILQLLAVAFERQQLGLLRRLAAECREPTCAERLSSLLPANRTREQYRDRPPAKREGSSPSAPSTVPSTPVLAASRPGSPSPGSTTTTSPPSATGSGSRAPGTSIRARWRRG